MDIAIPKSSYKRVYQLNLTPEIQLQIEFNLLKQNSERNGWTINNYNEYMKIRQGLKRNAKKLTIKTRKKTLTK